MYVADLMADVYTCDQEHKGEQLYSGNGRNRGNFEEEGTPDLS